MQEQIKSDQLTTIENQEKNALRKRLIAAGIDLSTWGKGQAKTFDHLFKEIVEGETILVEGENGELSRQVIVGKADIYYTDPEGKIFRLKEDRQVFKDGRERRRNLGAAVCEKLKPREEIKEAVERGIQEELGITGAVKLDAESTSKQMKSSPSYPGLSSEYVNHLYKAEISHNQFDPDGYVENQADKSTYFVWEQVN